MTSRGSTSATPVPVHVGFAEPQPEEPPIPGAPPRNPLFRQRRATSALRDLEFDWGRHNLEPRWLGTEAGNCAAALEPSVFYNHGGAELHRFLTGTATRGETALVVAVIGDLDDDRPAHPLVSADSTLLLPGVEESIAGARLPQGAPVSLAPGLNAADRDLGLRLLNSNRSDGAWWSVSLHGNVMQPGVGGPAVQYEATGDLQPILIDELGHPVVAAWTPGEADQRWYVIPDDADWHTVLDWLVQQALPEYVPGALRRARSPLALDPTLQTPSETSARERLAALDAEYAHERRRLESELEQAKAAAEPIRDGLLYGTARVLESAVAAVLRAAGLEVLELDESLGDTASADLLASDGSERRLVEVKSAGGSASESLVAALLRHLQTWPQLRPHEPVGGGVLIVNNQHRLEAADRTPSVYARKEFTNSLTVPVISTMQLFEWWRKSDWTAIRTAMLTRPGSKPASAATATPAAQPDLQPADDERGSGRRRRFSLRRAPD